jgi:hypothetical protein
MGAFQSSTNFGNICGEASFAILAIAIGTSWPPIVLVSSIAMTVAAALFFLFVEERPRGEYREMI